MAQISFGITHFKKYDLNHLWFHVTATYFLEPSLTSPFPEYWPWSLGKAI